jgi:ketosteroid isomerase-like protein
MTNAQAQDFAAAWIQNFSAKDVEAVLAHFAEDAQFTSPRALVVAGKATLQSRRELAEYWHAAVKSIGTIRFTLEHVINDESSGRLTIVYISEIDGKKVRAAEFFQFNSSLKVIRGEAMYGAALA